MNKKLILHDLSPADAQHIFGGQPEHTEIFSTNPKVHHCIGCFGCWIKTPGACVISERCSTIPCTLAASEEMVIISRMTYGGYSVSMKAVLDRSIPYLLPYFRIVNGEMHHVIRYDNPFQLTVHFYNEDLEDAECKLARQLVAGNAINMGAGGHQVCFHKSIEALKEVL